MAKEILVIADKQTLSPLVKKEVLDSIKKREKEDKLINVIFSDSDNQKIIIEQSLKSSLIVFGEGMSQSQIIEIWNLVIEKYIREENYLFPLFISIKKTRGTDYGNKIIRLSKMDLVGVFV